MLELPKSLPRKASLFLLALFFVGAGTGHFTSTEFFLSIVPPYLPTHLALVYLSGVFELLGGLGLLLGATRRLAGYGLIALLLAVYPANVHMAMNPELFPDMPAWGLYVRLPMQFLLIAWVWWTALPERE